MSITKAVIPVAGLGTRFLPFTKTIPKELLPIIDKPVLHYLVEEAVASGITEIVFVISKDKEILRKYFARDARLENQLIQKGKDYLVEQLKEISNLAKFHFAYQDQPFGDGHAILCAKDFLENEPFCILFGDDLVDHQIPCLKQLLNIYDQTHSSVIALKEVPIEQVSSYGVVGGEKLTDRRTIKIDSLVEKPAKNEAPSNWSIVGKYIVTSQIFNCFAETAKSHDGEIRLIDGLKELIKTQDIYGYLFAGERYDTGDKLGFIKATINYALKNTDYRQELIEFINQKIK